MKKKRRPLRELPFRAARRARAILLQFADPGLRGPPRSKWQTLPIANYPQSDAPDVVPLPSRELMWMVGGMTPGNFYRMGDSASQKIVATLERHGDRPPGATVASHPVTLLDMGCGSGSTARFLINLRQIRYVGFDIFRPAILWCRANFTRFGDRFRFEHFDGYSAFYNPDGKVRAADYRFPCEDATIDYAYAGSLFTHLLEPDARHYLHELARVLKPRALALLTIHNETPPGVHVKGNETRIDYETDYFIGMAREAGLQVIEQNQHHIQYFILFRK
jgi:SAM-dependent methyltransferase